MHKRWFLGLRMSAQRGASGTTSAGPGPPRLGGDVLDGSGCFGARILRLRTWPPGDGGVYCKLFKSIQRFASSHVNRCQATSRCQPETS